MALDLTDDGYLTVTVRPADGSAAVTADNLDLFCVFCQVQDALRKYLKSGDEDTRDERTWAADVQEIMRQAGLPTVSCAAAIDFANGVIAAYAERKKKPADGSTPASPASTASTPGSSPPASSSS